MARTVIIRVNNWPAEDEAYTLGAVTAPDDMSDEQIQERIADLYEFHKRSTVDPEDEEFLHQLGYHGFYVVDSPVEVTL